MLSNLGGWEVMALGLLALLILGPEQLPVMAAKAGRLIRRLRSQVSSVTDDLRREVGPETFDSIRDLHPKKWLDADTVDAVHDAVNEVSFDEPVKRPAPNLAGGEPAPFDPDAT